MIAAEIILMAVAAYLAAGLVFAVAFVWRGIAIVDPTARGAPLGMRLLILPGAAALWPVMAAKWRRAATGGARA